MKKCKMGHECASNAKSCPQCGQRFTGLVTKIVAVWFGLATVLALIALLSPTNDKPSKASAVPNTDHADALLSRCGPATKDRSSENETPRPYIVTRTIEYKWANIRMIFLPDGEPGSTSPHKWKLSLMSDLKGKGLTADDVRKRLPCASE